MPANADWLAESDQQGACLGSSVSMAGDIDADGYADVIVFHRKGTKNAKKKVSSSILNVKKLCVNLCVFASSRFKSLFFQWRHETIPVPRPTWRAHAICIPSHFQV